MDAIDIMSQALYNIVQARNELESLTDDVRMEFKKIEQDGLRNDVIHYLEQIIYRFDMCKLYIDFSIQAIETKKEGEA